MTATTTRGAGPQTPGRPPRSIDAGRFLKVRLAVAGVLAVAFVAVWTLPPTPILDGSNVAPVVDPADATVVEGRTVIVAPASDTAATSALTAKGKGEFADLEITVSQTTQLTNQAVSITWKGGKPTPSAPLYPTNFLQIMQCWGDNLTLGPDRTQCVFGAKAGSYTATTGNQVTTRQLSADIKDPAETYRNDGSQTYASFINVSGKETAGLDVVNNNSDFDRFNSNEIPVARTYADGTGSVVFEVATDTQQPGMGCGVVVNGSPRRCWLVIVPRGTTEVDGSTASQLATSALSATNWAGRIAFPLSFRSVGGACTLGSIEVPTSGSPLAANAVFSWQPKLCANNGPVFSYTGLGSANVLKNLVGKNPELRLVNESVPADMVPEDATLVYAPLLVSGLTIVVAYDRLPKSSASAESKLDVARPITGVKLTPRVVAKVLTGSYPTNLPSGAPHVAGNPDSLMQDPDFLYDNPQFADQEGNLDLVVPFGNEDVYRYLWEWIMADPAAADFIAGLPDNLSDVDKNTRKTTGMRVNPFYQGLDLPQSTFPKQDPFNLFTADVKRYNAAARAATPKKEEAPPLGQGDVHGYAGNLVDAAQYALRGDVRARTNFDTSTGVYGAVPAAGFGRRCVMSITDTASAARYSVTPALLRNAAGTFVGPDEKGLLAGVAAMTQDSAGVLIPNVGSSATDAYPLTMLTYAATRPGLLSVAAAKDYATFIRYAVGDGQTPGVLAGNLPAGFVPLPAALRTVATKAATDIQNRVGLVTTPKATTPKATTTTKKATAKATTTKKSTSGGTSSNNNSGSGNNGSSGNGATPTTAPATTPEASATGASASPVAGDGTTQTTNLARGNTPTETPGPGRFAVLTALLLGIAGALAGPAVPKLVRRPA